MERIFTVKGKKNRQTSWEVLDEVETLEEALQLREQYYLEHKSWMAIIVECRGAKC